MNMHVYIVLYIARARYKFSYRETMTIELFNILVEYAN